MTNALRLALLLGAMAVSVASSSSQSNVPPPTGPAGSYPQQRAPQSQAMDASVALGVWKSNFGPVKIEADPTAGTGGLMGVWVYDKNGQEIIGFFSGVAKGNVLEFEWEEPSPSGAPLKGAGYLEFTVDGQSYRGQWWTHRRDRGGEWNGWREQSAEPNSAPPPPDTSDLAPAGDVYRPGY